MPLPVITVPQFPNVPNVPGVPALIRSVSEASNTIAASITGSINTASNTFVGNVVGDIAQVNGLVATVSGIMRGIIDSDNHVNAALIGPTTGNVIGAITGTVNRTTGIIDGTVSGIVQGLLGGASYLTGDGAGVISAALAAKWGLYLDGAPVLLPDSIFAFEYNKDFRVSNYPLEGGAFESYNKVETPAEPRLTMTKGGSEGDRAAFLAQVKAIVASLDLYDIVTPNATFASMSVRHWAYSQRADQGANLLMIDLILEEVRVTATADFTNTAQPQGEATVNGGPVQAVPPTQDQITAAAGGAK